MRKKRKTVWAFLDGKKLVDVVQAALDNNMMVDDLKAKLIAENPGHEVTFIAERSRRTGINQDRVIQEIAKLAFLNPIDVIDMDEATIKGEANRDDTACIASVKVKVIPGEDGNITEREVKTYDKLKALELLGKHLGMFTDKLKMEGNVPVVIMGDDQLED